MLETCQKQHMLIGLTLLITVTIFALIIESRYAGSEPTRRGRTQQLEAIENNSTCWQQQEYTVIQECHPCTEFDIVRSLGVCIHTHYKEVLRCKSGETVTRSCDRVAHIDQQNFIKFEVACFGVGLLSFLVSYARDRVLARRTHLKIERQLNRMQ